MEFEREEKMKEEEEKQEEKDFEERIFGEQKRKNSKIADKWPFLLPSKKKPENRNRNQTKKTQKIRFKNTILHAET